MKAFPYVVALARKFGASVFACHVITLASLATAAPQAAPMLYEAEYNSASKELENIVGASQLNGLKTNVLLSSGILGDALLDWLIKFPQVLAIIWKIGPPHLLQPACLDELAEVR